MKITIIGAGASGSHLAYMLASRDDEILLVDSNPERVKQIRDNGISVMTGREQYEPVRKRFSRVYLDREARDNIKGSDVAIITTKAFNLNEDLGQQAKSSIADKNGWVVDLTNGVKPWLLKLPRVTLIETPNLTYTQAFGRKVGIPNLTTGIINYPSRLDDKGIVHESNGPKSIFTMEMVKGTFPLRDRLLSAGIECQTTGYIDKAVFEKLGSIMCIGLQTIFDRTSREIAQFDTPEGRLLRAILMEFHELAKRVDIDFGDVGDFLAKQQKVIEAKGVFKGSMWADIEKGGRTERGAIYGALSELAKLNYIDVPLIDATYRMLGVVESQAIRDNSVGRRGLPALRHKIATHIGSSDDPVEAYSDQEFTQSLGLETGWKTHMRIHRAWQI